MLNLSAGQNTHTGVRTDTSACVHFDELKRDKTCPPVRNQRVVNLEGKLTHLHLAAGGAGKSSSFKPHTALSKKTKKKLKYVSAEELPLEFVPSPETVGFPFHHFLKHNKRRVSLMARW